MRIGTHQTRDRAGAALAAAAIQALLLYGLITGLGVRMPAPAPAATQLLDFSLPPPPPVVKIKPPPPAPSKKPQGAASPPNIVSRATEVVAPVPVVVPPPLPVVVTAPQAGTGSDASSGNAPVAGPGTGAGGIGNGTGSGGAGDGSGAGEGIPLQLVRGDLYDSDYPDWAQRDGISGTVHFRLVVDVKGRVSQCRVTRSSGSPRLDELTCRLIEKRFRYVPSRDAQGRPYADVVIGEQTWVDYDRPE